MDNKDYSKENIFNILKNVPIHFIENKGQVDERVKYYAKGSQYAFYFTQNEVKFSFLKKSENETFKNEFVRVTIGQKFVNVNKNLKIEGISKLKGTVNYFKGNDPENWKTQIPNFKKIIYREIWKGIDLVFYCKDGKLKYDFIVKKSGNVEDIKFNYDGPYEKNIDDDGNLIIKTPIGELIDEKPVFYQEIKGEKANVKGNFIEIKEKNEVFYGYKVIDKYNPKYTLVIDPAISYSSYLGGADNDIGYEIAIDENNNIYVTGSTNSSDFPDENAFETNYQGNTDAFVTKIDSTPAIVYSSYLGGSGEDTGYGIAVDGSGNVYITGETSSNDFPTVAPFQGTPGVFPDAFVTKIDSTPAIVYSSYLGGNGEDIGYSIAVDGSGNVYVTGETQSSNFDTTSAFQLSYGGSTDAFVTKIDSTPAIVYSSYLGGSAQDIGNGIAVDGSGNAYVTGQTSSNDFPTLDAFQGTYGGSTDAFVTKIDSTPAIVYSSYLGGSLLDIGNGIAVDGSGNAYVTGETSSNNFDVTNAFQSSLNGSQNAFVTKIDSIPAIVYSSYLGGSTSTQGEAIAVDINGNAYITGLTSSGFPTLNAFQDTYGGGLTDAFITKINSNPSVIYSSYLGGLELDVGYGVVVSKSGYAYVTGQTQSTDFPVKNAFQPSNAGGIDVFVTRIGGPVSLIVNLANLTAELFD